MIDELRLNMDYMLDLIYPVGSIYMSVNSTSPSLLFGGRWVQIKDRFLLACGTTYANATTGGESTHTLTTNEMPSHTHTQNGHTHGTTSGRNFIAVGDGDNWGYTSAIKIGTSSSGTAYYYPHSDKNTSGITEPSATASTTATNQNTGGGQAHNNMPPYLTVYMWKRIEDYDYIVNTVSELTNALTNVSEGKSIYINSGTYTLSQQYSLPSCTIIGNNATIVENGFNFDQNTSSPIEISGITFDGNNVQNMSVLVDINTVADVHIHNCTFTNKKADWNGDNICIHCSGANNIIEINNCTFTGDNYCNGYGHSKGSIIYFGNDGQPDAYNINIHHNTFDHNENVGDSGNLNNGRAICFISATLHDCIAYCNTYVGSEDTNDGITESQCSD